MAEQKNKRLGKKRVLKAYKELGPHANKALIAKLARVSERTLYRYETEEDFQKAFEELKIDIESVGLATVIEVMEHGKDSSRLAAAQYALETVRPERYDSGIRKEKVRREGNTESLQAFANAMATAFRGDTLPPDPLEIEPSSECTYIEDKTSVSVQAEVPSTHKLTDKKPYRAINTLEDKEAPETIDDSEDEFI